MMSFYCGASLWEKRTDRHLQHGVTMQAQCLKMDSIYITNELRQHKKRHFNVISIASAQNVLKF